MLERAKNRPRFDVPGGDVSVESRIEYLKNLLRGEDKPVVLREVFERQPSRRAMIATLLAVLEMVRMQAIILRQDKLFGEIVARKHKMFDVVFSSGPTVACRRSGVLGVSDQPRLASSLPDETARRALLEAIVYVAEEPLTLEQIASGLELPVDVVKADLEALTHESQKPERGIEIRLVANGYKMSTKAVHHETVRNFVGTLRPKLRLSLPALETLSVIAYKQPATIPEIQAIRGVNVTGVVHTLLSRKLITTAGPQEGNRKADALPDDQRFLGTVRP